jgi:hypothetical protein
MPFAVDGWIDEKILRRFFINCNFTVLSEVCANFLDSDFDMKDIYKDEDFEIPEGVTVDVKSRLVTVKGPRGELTKSLRHIDMEIRKVSDRKIKLVVWHGGRKHVACLRTVRSLISNMINGVTKVRFSNLSRLTVRDSDTRCVMSMPISPLTLMSLSKNFPLLI